MKFSKIFARKVVFPIVIGIGVDKLMRYFIKPRILFVMYHGVVKEDANYFSARHLVKEQFDRQMNYIFQNFDLVNVEEAFLLIKNKTKLKRHTFDDGFENNLHTALPIIEKYKIPTTVFVSSLCTIDSGKKYLWAEVVETLKYFHKNETIEIDDYKFKNFYDAKNQISMLNFLKKQPCEKRDLIIKKLEEDFGILNKMNSLPKEIWKLMSKDELITLASSKFIKIGTHGHNHYNLGLINSNDAEKDIRLSKSLIEETLDIEVNSIAYPDGSYSEDVKNIAEKLGLKYQLAVSYLFDGDKDDARILNRHGVSSGTTFESNMFFLNKALKTKGIKLN